MDWDVLLDGTSIKNRVTSFDINKEKGSFCKTLDLQVADWSLRDEFDSDAIPASPRVEVKTKINSVWETEGLFFIERADIAQNEKSISLSLWGRDQSAKLTAPFVRRLSKEWGEDTTLYAIIEELLGYAGLAYSYSRILISDYIIYAGSYSVQDTDPLSALQELVSKTDGFLYTDSDNNLWVLKDTYNWDVPVQIVRSLLINETVEYPVFCNRIRIGSYSSGQQANVAISLEIDASSIPIHGESGDTTTARAVVTDNDGAPVANGYTVDWTSDNDAYASWVLSRTYVNPHRISAEIQAATSQLLVSTSYPIRQVHSVVEVQTGEVKTVREFKGTRVTLDEDTPLTYTDSSVRIDYETGYAENTLEAGSIGEVEVDVHAIVCGYIRDTRTIRIDTQSGPSSGDKDMYVTLIVEDFVTEEPVPGAIPTIDETEKAAVDEDGELDLGLLAGGEHSISIEAEGYKLTGDDGLDNDVFMCSTSD